MLFTLLKTFIVLLFIAPSLALSAPFYSGKNPTPETTAYLEIFDSPTQATATRDTGNIFGMELGASALVTERLALRTHLPLYFASANAVGSNYSDSGIGNLPFEMVWTNALSSSQETTRFAYWATFSTYLPLSRDRESRFVALSDPTLRLLSFSPYTTSVAPTLGVAISQNRWSAKTNIGYGLHLVSKDSLVDGNNVQNSGTFQVAGSYHPTSYLNLNLEYNSLLASNEVLVDPDSGPKFKNAVVPSVSGEYRDYVGSLYVSVPFDEATRDRSLVSVGARAGYTF